MPNEGGNVSNDTPSKTCTKCGEPYPATAEFFQKRVDAKDGFRSDCKFCVQKRSAEYQKSNKERLSQQHKEWREANREHWQKNEKEWRKNNAQRIYDKNLAARLADPEGSRKSRRESARRRRAKKRQNGIEFYTEAQVLETYGSDCYICCEPVDLKAPRSIKMKDWQYGLHIEHVVPIALGGSDTLKNVRPSHAICNLRKGASMPDMTDLLDLSD